MVKLFIILFLSTIYSQTIINIPGDYNTIQGGINAASDGDEIRVSSGTYTENLVIESDIKLTSVDGPGSTTIVGTNGASGAMGSVITVRPQSGSAVVPQNIEIDGFEITGGSGNLMTRNVGDNQNPDWESERIGGGIMSFNAPLTLRNNNITGNGTPATSSGGGITIVSSAEDWDFNDRWEANPELQPVNVDLDLSSNTFDSNFAFDSKSVEIRGFEDNSIDMTNSSFDCFSSEYQDVSDFWISGASTFNYEGSQGTEPNYSDVWVDPVDGIDTGNTIGDMSNPYKTINYAMGMIFPTDENPVNIHLLPGRYSPSDIFSEPGVVCDEIFTGPDGDTDCDMAYNSDGYTCSELEQFSLNCSGCVCLGDQAGAPSFLNPSNGDVFPIYLKGNVNLIGPDTDDGIAVIDAGSNNNQAINLACTPQDACYNSNNTRIANLTITGAYAIAYFGNHSERYGGAVGIVNSYPILENLDINNNFAAEQGSAISFYRNEHPEYPLDDSRPKVINSSIHHNLGVVNNQLSWSTIDGAFDLSNVSIYANSSHAIILSGDGIKLDRVTMMDNFSNSSPVHIFRGEVDIINTTIYNNHFCGLIDYGYGFDEWCIIAEGGDAWGLYNDDFLNAPFGRYFDYADSGDIFHTPPQVLLEWRDNIYVENSVNIVNSIIYNDFMFSYNPSPDYSLELKIGNYDDGYHFPTICQDDNDAMINILNMECQDAAYHFGCDSSWENNTLVSDLCPLTCNTCVESVWDNIHHSNIGGSFFNTVGYDWESYVWEPIHEALCYPHGNNNLARVPQNSLGFDAAGEGCPDSDYPGNLLNGTISHSDFSECLLWQESVLDYSSGTSFINPIIDAGTADIDGDGEIDIANYNGFAPDIGSIETPYSNDSQVFLNGDVNGDDSINVVDIVCLIDIILGNAESYGGDGDLNNDGILNILDVTLLVTLILESNPLDP